MISDCDFSGVITTCNLSNQAPYYVVNYYDGKDTTAATSGKANTKNYFQFKYKYFEMEPQLLALITLGCWLLGCICAPCLSKCGE